MTRQPEPIAVLEEASRALRGMVTAFGERGGAPEETLLRRELPMLSRELACVAQLLPAVSSAWPRPPHLEAVIAEYVHSLERLRPIVEKAQESLGKKRDRLKQDLDRLGCVRAWAETYLSTNER